jgi:hypothetical protein
MIKKKRAIKAPVERFAQIAHLAGARVVLCGSEAGLNVSPNLNGSKLLVQAIVLSKWGKSYF